MDWNSITINYELLTFVCYVTIFSLWLGVFSLYLANIRKHRTRHNSVTILLTILAIDALRTVIESGYFGIYFGSMYEFLPPSLSHALGTPSNLLIPKFINMAAAVIILFWLLRFWIPKEVEEKEHLAMEADDASRLLGLTRFSINQIADGLFWIDKHGKILEVNASACQKLGYSYEELLTMSVPDIDPDYRIERWPSHWDELKAEKSLNFTSKHLTKSGKIIPVDVTANYMSYGGKEYNCAIVRDLSDRTDLDAIIWRQANYDELTELPNRRLFSDRLNEALLLAKRSKTMLAVVFVDLDHFKDINDTHGHEFGDHVLKESAARLKAVLRESDTLARFAGDEFSAILPNVNSQEAIYQVLRRMLQSVTEPIEVDGTTFQVSVSIGVTFYPDDALSPKDLLVNADQAMYQAKQDGRNQIGIYTPQLRKALNSRVTLLTELRAALELNQFELFYQPIINLQTGETMEVEALLRWKHPDKGMVSPAAFIDIAEENNIIIDMGDWVVRNALTGLKRLQEVSSELNMAINTSPAHFRHQDCIEGWFKDIEDAGIAGKHLAFEITERLLMPSQEEKIGLQTVLEKIHQKGIKTSIDDFGTGYSSLAYIKRYNIDYVKIDKSFISSITNDEHDLAIVEAIIVMAHKLGMKVIAEGIESHEQQERLKSLGCDYAQGYFIGKPMPINDMAEYLACH